MRILCQTASSPLIVALVLIAGMLGAGAHMPNLAASVLAAQDDGLLLRELAERLLHQQSGYPGSSPTPDQRVQLLPGQLPDDPWFDLPMPPGGRLVGSAVRPAVGPTPGGPTPRTQGFNVVFDAPGLAQQVEDFFTQALLALGWKMAPVGYPGGGGGFQPPRVVRSQYFCQTTGPAPDPNEMGPGLTLSVSPGVGGTNDARLSTTGGGPPCWTPTAPQPVSAVSRPYASPMMNMPALTAPADVQLETQGFSGGRGSYGSEARATTSRTLRELDSLFTTQLQAAGWMRLASQTDEAVSWSTWRVPSDEDEQLGMLLIVRTPGENRRGLSLRVYSAAPDSEPYSTSYGYPYYPYQGTPE